MSALTSGFLFVVSLLLLGLVTARGAMLSNAWAFVLVVAVSHGTIPLPRPMTHRLCGGARS